MELTITGLGSRVRDFVIIAGEQLVGSQDILEEGERFIMTGHGCAIVTEGGNW